MPRAYYLGDEAEEVARAMWPDSDVSLLTDEAKDAEHVLLHKLLQHMSVEQAMAVVKKVAGITKAGGSITITVPSVDWAARQLIRSDVVDSAWFAIYGDSRAPHLSGYDMRRLRTLLAHANYITIEASAIDEELRMHGKDGAEDVLPYRLNVVTGVKRDVALTE